MEIRRKEYYIRKLKYEDGKLLSKWSTFESPLFSGYNYNNLTDSEIKIWYKVKQPFYRSSYFSVMKDEENLIGYVGIKEINRFLKKAKLGIVLDPNYVSKGYGTKIMLDFLYYYFNTLNMKKLVLEVNDWNFRARKMYENLGFTYESEKFEYFENQNLDLYTDYMKEYKNSFIIKRGSIYSKTHIMSLRKQEYKNET